jgi:MraZ protein
MAILNQNSAAPVFMGEFCHAMDGKNRLTIPSAWRFEEAVELFLIPRSASRCLMVMTRSELDRIREKAQALPGTQRTALLRRIGSQSHQVTLDKNGRLSLPEEFCRQLRLSNEVTLVGAVETFEIWNTAEWKAAGANTDAIANPLLPDLGL